MEQGVGYRLNGFGLDFKHHEMELERCGIAEYQNIIHILSNPFPNIFFLEGLRS